MFNEEVTQIISRFSSEFACRIDLKLDFKKLWLTSSKNFGEDTVLKYQPKLLKGLCIGFLMETKMLWNALLSKIKGRVFFR